MGDSSSILSEIRNQIETLQQQLALMEANKSIPEIVLQALREKIAGLENELEDPKNEMTTRGVDFTGRDKTIEAGEKGTAIGRGAINRSIIHDDTVFLSEKYWGRASSNAIGKRKRSCQAIFELPF